MDAQSLAIYNIVKLKRYEYVSAKLVPYFSGLSKKAYFAIFDIRRLKAEVTEEIIKNYITRSGWKKELALMVVDHVHNIVSQNIITSKLNIPKLLQDEYFQSKYENIRNMMNNKSSTTEMINTEIESVAEVIKKSKEADDMTTYDEVIYKMSEDHQNGIPSQLQKQNIYLDDHMLIDIFGKVIAPEPYTILGRPGDGKSTLAIYMIAHFKSLKKRGIFISLEDNRHIASLKIFAMESGMDFEDLKNQHYNTTEFDKYLGKRDSMVIILDKLRTAQEIADDVSNICASMDIHYVVIDYVQRIKSKHGEIYKKMSEISDMLLALNKELNLPIIQLSQVDKDSAKSLGTLGMGSAKGAGELDANTRHGVSLNPTGQEAGVDNRFCKEIFVYKGVKGNKKFIAEFDCKSRKMMGLIGVENDNTRAN